MTESPSSPHVRLAIIGSGPAGLTAALYAGRANLEPWVIAGVPAGGQLTLTSEVENFPGFPEGIQGPELVERIRQQAAKFGTRFIDDNVRKVDFSHRPFTLVTGSYGTIEADCVIVATGANARWLGLPNEERLRGKGVSACATCDGFFFKGRELIVVGGGDSAMEEAIFLTKFATHVTIVHRRSQLRASRILQRRARENPKISFLFDAEVVDVRGDDHVAGIQVREGPQRSLREIKAEGLFVAIGHDPATEVFRGALDLDPKGYVRTREITRTSVEGVFAAGDVYDHRYRQAVSAAGLGCMAALDAEKFLEEETAASLASL